jgi:hypothetical protein
MKRLFIILILQVFATVAFCQHPAIGSYYNSVQQLFPLDQIAEQPKVAYSVRKLRSTYTGAALRVRRASDNAEMDIGFTVNGDFNASAYTTFIASTTGFVTVWYDQTGGLNHLRQTTTTNQFSLSTNAKGILCLDVPGPGKFLLSDSTLNEARFSVIFCKLRSNNSALVTRESNGAGPTRFFSYYIYRWYSGASLGTCISMYGSIAIGSENVSRFDWSTDYNLNSPNFFNSKFYVPSASDYDNSSLIGELVIWNTQVGYTPVDRMAFLTAKYFL